jgi:hypothetical protein
MSRRRRPSAGHGSGVRYWGTGPPVVDPRCTSPRLLPFIGVTDQPSRSKTDKRAVFECFERHCHRLAKIACWQVEDTRSSRKMLRSGG